MKQLSRAQLRGRTHRLILSRFPVIGVFDDLVEDEDELRIAYELEAATNPRLSQSAGRLRRLPKGEIVTAPDGAGATMVMAAFIHTSESGGRFHDGDLGAWYAATDIDTAIAETVHHNERRLRMSDGGFPNRIQLRELITAADLMCLDVRGCQAGLPDLYRRDDYRSSQTFARKVRWPFAEPGADAIAYDSVRRDGGENLAIFRPKAVQLPVVQGDHYQYDWDSAGTITITKLTKISSG